MTTTSGAELSHARLIISASTRTERLRLLRDPLPLSIQTIGHSNEFRQRLRTHLVHDARSLDFDGFLSRPQFSANLFVEQALRNQREDLSFTTR
jgi:hypothetical protein